jgi:hypothetical protein
VLHAKGQEGVCYHLYFNGCCEATQREARPTDSLELDGTDARGHGAYLASNVSFNYLLLLVLYTYQCIRSMEWQKTSQYSKHSLAFNVADIKALRYLLAVLKVCLVFLVQIHTLILLSLYTL